MFGNLYIKGKSDEYVKTVIPFEAVTSISDAAATKIMFSPLDVESVGDFANNVVVRLINTTDSLDWIIEVWNEDVSEQWGTLVLDDCCHPHLQLLYKCLQTWHWGLRTAQCLKPF